MSTSFNGDTSPQPPPRPQVPQPLELQENYKDRQLPLLPQQGDDSVSKHEKGETFLTFDLLTQSEGGGVGLDSTLHFLCLLFIMLKGYRQEPLQKTFSL